MPDQPQDTTIKTKTGKADPDLSLIFTVIAAQAIMICIEAFLDQGTEIDAAITGAAHNDHASPIEATAIGLTTTCHINHNTDHPHIEVLQLINPVIAVGPIHVHHATLQGRTHIDQVHTPADHEENHTPRRTQG